MSATGRGSPAISEFGNSRGEGRGERGDGTLTPVLNGGHGSPRTLQSNLTHSSQSLRSTSGRSTHNGTMHAAQHSTTSVAASAVVSHSTRSSSGRHRSQNHLAPGDHSRGSSSRSQKTATSSGQTPLEIPTHRYRKLPNMSHSNTEPASATQLYWSRAPVWGCMPNHGLRAHSATLVENLVWIFGGCDERSCFKDVWLFNTETMEWTNPKMVGEIPPPCRAHSATLVDRKIVVFGGGEDALYYNTVYVLDTATRKWTHIQFPADAPHPANRRAHTAVLYNNKIWVYGGGNGTNALDDVWTLSVNVPYDQMRWEEVQIEGPDRPGKRGYHTATLVGNIMVVLGGSDGSECFSDVWCLNLDELTWRKIKTEEKHRRLAHTVTQVGSYLMSLSGHDGASYRSDLLFFNLMSLSYEKRLVSGKGPSNRGYHATVLADSRLFVFGGFNGSEVFEDVYVLDLAGCAYLAQVTSFRITFDLDER